MQTLKIIPKSKARQIQQRQGLKGMRYSSEVFDWKGEGPFVGKPIQVPDKVAAVFIDQRQDEYGYYTVLMCLLKKEEKETEHEY